MSLLVHAGSFTYNTALVTVVTRGMGEIDQIVTIITWGKRLIRCALISFQERDRQANIEKSDYDLLCSVSYLTEILIEM